MRMARTGFAVMVFVAAAAAQDAAQSPAFEVASVKAHQVNGAGTTGRTGIEEGPGGIRIENLSLRALLVIAYGVQGRDGLSGPAWLDEATFDIAAKPPAGYKHEQLAGMLRGLLIERFGAVTHQETRPVAASALLTSKGGFKLQESTSERTFHTGRRGLIEGKHWTIAELTRTLTTLLGQRVLDETGLTGAYDLKLEWSPDTAAAPVGAVALDRPADEGPSLFTALEQIGLRVEARHIPGDVVVVDHIERAPSAN